MTFVAVLYADSFPLAVVDSMVSRRGNDADGTPSPLRDEVDQHAADGQQPIGLGRKFWLLPDRSLFLYAGTIGSAQKLFDFLTEQLSGGERYDRNMHQIAREYREQRTTSNFSFIVLCPADKENPIHCEGLVYEEEIDTYGYVIAIGSGAQEGLRMLREHAGVAPNTELAKTGNALNLAARLTLDYQDEWQRGSTMSAASCGGYFEVVPPALYKIGYEHLLRNTVQVFLKRERNHVYVQHFIVAHQGDAETIIVAGRNLGISLDGTGFTVDYASLRQYTVRATQIETVVEAPFNGKYPFTHVKFLTTYGHGFSCCGVSGHELRRHTLSEGVNGPIAMVYEDDSGDFATLADSASQPQELLRCELITPRAQSPLDQMCITLFNEIDCPHCR